MTNAEKYLKEGVDINQMATEMVNYFNFPPYEGIGESSIEAFFDKEVKPTLTEDERVILRNIDKKIKYITRDNSGYLYITEKSFSMLALPFSIYNHLFQFIENGEEYSIKELLGDEK